LVARSAADQASQRYDAAFRRPASLMPAKAIIVILLIAVVAALLTSMIFLVRDPSTRRRTLIGLKIRVALSVTLLVFLLFSYFMGWIQPHGIVP